MEESKLDKIIRKKFQNRSLEPSVSSWERMENMLEASEKKSKKKWFFFVGIAASIIILFGVFLKMNTNQENINNVPTNNEVIVTVPSREENKENDISIEKKTDFKENVIKNNTGVALVKESVKVEKTINKTTDLGLEKLSKIIEKTFEIKNTQESFAINKTNAPVELKNLDNLVKSAVNKNRIRVSGDDLLYVVTHSPKEVKEYYANLKLNRNDVLDSIKFQLKKSKLKINPELILAEVERSIEDDEYQGNFKDNLGRRISTIIVAVANRNK